MFAGEADQQDTHQERIATGGCAVIGISVEGDIHFVVKGKVAGIVGFGAVQIQAIDIHALREENIFERWRTLAAPKDADFNISRELGICFRIVSQV